MQRYFLLLAFLLGMFVPAQARSPRPKAAPKPVLVDTALVSKASDSLNAVVPAVVVDSAAIKAAEDSVFKARAAARRDSIAAAREEAGSSVEWRAVSDSGDAGTAPKVVGPVATIEPAVVSRPIQRSQTAFPEVPPEQESKILMWTGIGLAIAGLVAFFAISGSGEKQAEEASLNPTTDPTAGNNDAKTQKTMTIRWSH
ncbi:MAG: hypothetical protein RL318_2390 [Fibrobacterota bacterium]|jgi:hypothetical protein